MAKQAKKQRSKEDQTTAATVTPQSAGTESADAISMLMNDHRTVEQLFERYRSAASKEEKAQIAQQVCTEIGVHTKLEEEIFYPACREKISSEPLDEAQVEHDGAKILTEDLLHGSPEDEFYDAKMTVLEQYIKHHVGEEEKPADGIFAQARSAGLDVNELGRRLQTRKAELSAQAQGGRFVPPEVRSLNFQGNTQQEAYMARYQERDERGRFESEDEGSGRRRSRRDEDEGGRGHGGWFGDSEGHSRAAEMRWEGGSRSKRRDEDDEEDNGGRGRSSGRGHGGWFGDPEGHSRAAEARWEGESRGGGSRSSRGRSEDDYDDEGGRGRSSGRGHGGWFGDSEGHARAAEARWEGESRGGGSSRSRSRRDEDDDEGGRGRGGGSGRGWFGDSRGHSEAARHRNR
ncbi:MAG TPA: hemerythrin domain-containing protein [Steroidobacteraceae bacterium]|nr:hemerythrin domain-containing protein [Steroidobacteraceae bacterium]